jgi:predicted nucleic acid-binding protein
LAQAFKSEIAKGISLLNESKKKQDLLAWLQALEGHYGDRILTIDLETSHTWGELVAAWQQAGKTIPATDGLIAATARRHGLHVMTRNTEHFAPTGVLIVNPWSEQPGDRDRKTPLFASRTGGEREGNVRCREALKPRSPRECGDFHRKTTGIRHGKEAFSRRHSAFSS